MGNRLAAITIGFALKFSNEIEQLRNNNNQEIASSNDGAILLAQKGIEW